MRKVSSLCTTIVLALVAIGIVGCDELGSPVVLEPEASASVIDLPVGTLIQTSDAPTLEKYSTTFTVVQRHKAQNLMVSYDDGQGNGKGKGPWFVKLHIPQGTQILTPDGVPLADGDSIVVTLQIDQNRYAASFGPHGLQFEGRKPAKLSFMYEFADLAGRDPSELRLYYQPVAGEVWTPQATDVDRSTLVASMELYHFSNYAVAF